MEHWSKFLISQQEKLFSKKLKYIYIEYFTQNKHTMLILWIKRYFIKLLIRWNINKEYQNFLKHEIKSK